MVTGIGQILHASCQIKNCMEAPNRLREADAWDPRGVTPKHSAAAWRNARRRKWARNHKHKLAAQLSEICHLPK